MSSLVFDQYPLNGIMPPGWQTVSLGQIAVEVTPGFPSGEHNSVGRGLPHLRPMNVDRDGRLDFAVVKFVDGAMPQRLALGDVLFNNTNKSLFNG